MFIRNDIFYTKGFTINLASAFIYILSCGVTIVINARNHLQFLRHNILANLTTFILFKFEIFVIFCQIILFNSCNFLFQLFLQQQLTLDSHLLNHTSLRILVQNDIKYSIQIVKRHRLGYIIKIFFKNCFITLVDYNAASTPPRSLLLFHKRNGITILLADVSLEIELPNNIKIYKNKQIIEKIIHLVNKYLLIWESLDFVQIPPEWQIKINLKLRWKSKISSIKPKFYPLGIDNTQLDNKTFDELQHLDYLKYTTFPISFSFSVFVIQKIVVNGKKKSQAVVDIRKLNKLVIPNAYLLLFQSEIIANNQEYINLAMLNAI